MRRRLEVEERQPAWSAGGTGYPRRRGARGPAARIVAASPKASDSAVLWWSTTGLVKPRAAGLPLRSVLFRHLLPNALAPLLVSASFGVAGAILSESTLSFLGLGIPIVDDPLYPVVRDIDVDDFALVESGGRPDRDIDDSLDLVAIAVRP